MYCVIAVEGEVAQIIKDNLSKIESYADWAFGICEHSWNLDEYSKKQPDVLILSRFLPGEEPGKLLAHIQPLFSGSHIVLLAGQLDESCKGYLRAAKRLGLNNYVTGTLPGDRPYTLPVALTRSRENDEIDFELELEPLPETKTTLTDQQQESKSQQTEQVTESEVPVVKPVTEKEIPIVKPIIEQEPVKQESENNFVCNRLPQQEPKCCNYRPEPETSHISQEQSQCIEPIPVPEPQPQQLKRPRKFKRGGGIFILTTSNKGGVGKTTVAVTLAVALARNGLPTALCDFDFEAPDVATFFDIEGVPGIESLAGRTMKSYYVEDLLIEKEENLHVLPGVMDKTLPYFNGGQLGEIIEALTDNFPVVIGDTPPGFWTKEWMSELFERTDIVYSIVDQSKFSEKETMKYAPRLIEQGVEPEKVRIVLNKFSPKLHNAKIVEKHFCAGFKDTVSKKMLPRVVATITEDWDTFNKKVYKGEVTGLDDAYSQWHRLVEEVAHKAGLKLGTPQKQKKGFSLLGKFKKKKG